MANWSPLRELLSGSGDEVTLAWSDMDSLVGGLPRSAYDYSAFWKGDRSAWRGYTTKDVHVGTSVTFVRRDRSPAVRTTPATTPTAQHHDRLDLVLIGCVKRKVPRAAEARDLYDSVLFRRERAYAEASEAPWVKSGGVVYEGDPSAGVRR